MANRHSLIPSPARPRRSSAITSPAKSQYLSPNKVNARDRSASFPDSPAASPNDKRKPRLSSQLTPSRLPRPSTKHHRTSVSLEVVTPSERASVLAQPSPTPRQLSAAATLNHTSTPRRVSVRPASPSPHPRRQRHSPLPIAVPKSQPLHIDVPALPLTATPPPPRKFFKRDPRQILDELCSLVNPVQVNEYLPLDVLLAVHERELMEGAARLQRAKSIKGHSDGLGSNSSNNGPMGVFGFPLRQIALYASTEAVLGGFEHDLPIVVFACIEELYRSGISTPSNPTPTSPSPNKFLTKRTLSSSPPNTITQTDANALTLSEPRINALIAIFDSPSENFGLFSSLKDEASDDVYQLLTTFLSQLPEPVLAPLEILEGMRNALWTWCVKPPLCPRSSHLGSGSGTLTMSTRIRAAQLLLGLLPTPNLSLFVYLMAFSCQVLEVRMKRRRRESAAKDSLALGSGSGSGSLSSLEAQLLALERELEGKNEREREKKKLGQAWGGWLFGTSPNSNSNTECEFDSGSLGAMLKDKDEGSESHEEDTRSTQVMVWLVSNWGEIIRGFFDRGISVDPEPTLSVPEPEPVRPAHIQSIQQQDLSLDIVDEGNSVALLPPAMTESLFTSSASLNRLRGRGGGAEGVSPNCTPKQSSLRPTVTMTVNANMDDPFLSACATSTSQSASFGRINGEGPVKSFRMGLVRGQSYGQTIMVTPQSEQVVSIHSRYSKKSEAMVKEDSMSSVSALDERLLDLPQVDLPMISKLQPITLQSCTPSDESVGTRSCNSSDHGQLRLGAEAAYHSPQLQPQPNSDSDSDSEFESELTYRGLGIGLGLGPLRVVNCSHSGCSSSSSESDSEAESLYSELSCSSNTYPIGATSSCSSRSSVALDRTSIVASKSSRVSSEEGVDVKQRAGKKDDAHANRHSNGPFGSAGRSCNQCLEGCPVHLYAKELEIQVTALVKENSMLRLALHGQ